MIREFWRELILCPVCKGAELWWGAERVVCGTCLGSGRRFTKGKIQRRETPARIEGVWVAFYWDWSDVVLFDSEVDALRHAVENQMSIKFVTFGKSINEQIQ